MVFLIILCLSSPPHVSKKRRKGHRSHRSVDSENLDKLWEAVSQQGTVLAQLLREHTAPPAPSVLLEQQGAPSTGSQLDNLLSIAASEEMGDPELPSLDHPVPVAHPSLSAELLSLTVVTFQRLMGFMAVASQTFPLSLFHMRLLQAWFKNRVFQPTLNHVRLLTVSRHCLERLSKWAHPARLRLSAECRGSTNPWVWNKSVKGGLELDPYSKNIEVSSPSNLLAPATCAEGS
ncbi:UNVERIFIED_CONTAM: hypothetical protein FKN15_038469 [Acipenser sinensis]